MVLPIGNTSGNGTAVVPSEEVNGILPGGNAPLLQNGTEPQSSQTQAPESRWWSGAQYSGAQYLVHSVSCHVVLPNCYDLSSELYYVLLSVWDDGSNANSYYASSYDQLGLASNFGSWNVIWSYTTPDLHNQSGLHYHTTISAVTLSTDTEYIFSMALSGGVLTYSVQEADNGAILFSTSIMVGNPSTDLIVAATVYYPYGNYGTGSTYADFTDYLECWYMDPTIQSPAFNWAFLYTSADSSYVSTYSTFIWSSAPFIAPKWVDTYTGANGYVIVWSGLYRFVDSVDSSAFSIGSAVRWEDNTIWLAWRGTSNTNLNTITVTPDMEKWYNKNTLTSQKSPYGPSIIWTHEAIGSHLVMAWVGTGTKNYINTYRSTDGQAWTDLWTGTASGFPKSDMSPSLAYDSNNNILYMAYRDATTHKIVILRSTTDAGPGSSAPWAVWATLSQTTSDAPAICWAGTQLFYLAFVSDTNPGYIKVMQSTDGLTWTNQKTLPYQVASSSALTLGLTCTRDGLTVSWYDSATGMVSFTRSAGGDTRFWGEKFSLPLGTFAGSVTMCGLPKLDRYLAYTTGGDLLNLMKVCWNTNNPRYGTVDGFVDGFEDSTAFSQDWTFVWGTPHDPTTTQHHRGSYSYMMTQDVENIQHTLLPSSSSQTGLTGRFEIWMYDPGPSTYVKVGMAVTETSPSACFCSIGIMSEVSGDYVYRYSGTTYYDTGVARTQGWHCLQIVVDGTNTIGYIDGVKVFTVSWLTNVNNISIGDMWGDGCIASSVAWDDASFSTNYVTAT